MQTPGPDHPITIRQADGRWRALFHNAVIADSANALELQEASYPPVVYFPKEDVSLEYAAKTDHRTHCPYKGDASYYTFKRDTEFAENVAWSYEDPNPAVAQIAGHIAFYPDRVEVYRPLTVDPKEARRQRFQAAGSRIVTRHRPLGRKA